MLILRRPVGGSVCCVEFMVCFINLGSWNSDFSDVAPNAAVFQLETLKMDSLALFLAPKNGDQNIMTKKKKFRLTYGRNQNH